MGGIHDPMLDMLLQLDKEGWTIVDMSTFEPHIGKIASWCRENFGNMMINPDVDIGRWFGTSVTFRNEPKIYFAFKDASDYTLMQLRWA